MFDFIIYKLKVIYLEYHKWVKQKKVLEKFPTCSISNDSLIDDQVVLSNNVVINSNVTLRGSIHLGRGTFINGPTVISSSKDAPIEVGSFCSIAGFVYIISGHHSINRPSSFQISSGPYAKTFKNNIGKTESITIGHDVWIGSHAVILSGVTIGDGAVIGAGSVVTKDIEPYSIVGGVPAKLIKYRFNKTTIEKLREIHWWDWPDEDIKDNLDFFYSELE